MHSDLLYVATDSEGREHLGDGEITWRLPPANGELGPAEETAISGAHLSLRRAAGLLDALEARIFLAEATGEIVTDSGDTLEVRSARLLAATTWDDEHAARFALDCAEHVLGAAANTELPGGSTLAGVIGDARRVLDDLGADAEVRLGFLARLGAARRLKKEGELVGDLALALLSDDTTEALAALDDPRWATLAAVGDAVLAAVETLRHLALPRYVASREDVIEEHSIDNPSAAPTFITTPWGPIALGAEHHSPYVASWVSARDAAARARDAARDRDGESGEKAERAWQADRLEVLLRRS